MRCRKPPNFKIISFACAWISVLANSETGSAQLLYSVNTATDTLLRIDPASGAVTAVGPIGHEMFGADLAYLGGVVYAITANGPDGFADPGWTLLAINPRTGAKISAVPALLTNGQRPRIVESMAAVGDRLVLGMQDLGTVSQQLADIDAATGVITNIVGYEGRPGCNGFGFGGFSPDFDGLGTDPQGRILAADGDSGLVTIARVIENPPSCTVLHQFNHGAGINDAASANDATFGLGRANLYEFNLTGGNFVERSIDLGEGNVSLDGLAAVPAEEQTLMPGGATWRYLDNGSNQAAQWRLPGFNDSTWSEGLGQFGYGDGDEATIVDCRPEPGLNCSATVNPPNKFITTYFRTTFDVADLRLIEALTLHVLRDDGAAVYLNGTEVARDKLPPDAAFDTLATDPAVAGADEGRFFSFTVDPGFLVAGTNTLAAEVHQQSVNSSDLSFDLRLEAVAVVIPEPIGAVQLFLAMIAFAVIACARAAKRWCLMVLAVASVVIALRQRDCRADIPPGNVWPNPTLEQIATPGDESTAVPFYWSRLGPSPTGNRYSTARSVSPSHSLHVTDNSPQFWFWRSERLNLDTALPGVHFIDIHWHELYSVMNANMRFTANLFTNPLATEDEGNTNYDVVGTSSGWAAGTFTARREMLYVPPVRSHLEFQVVSGGSTTGDLYVDDIAVTSSIPAGGTTLVPGGTTSRYHDAGTNPGAGWNTLGFNDSGWQSGAAKFGYGDDDESTIINCGPSAPDCDSGNLPAAFFRRTFLVANPAQFADPTVYLVRDDAAAVYINGVEVFRDTNLPVAATFGTYATATTPRDNTVAQFTFDRNLLRLGTNVVAVEVHQASATSSDLSFDLHIEAAPIPEPATGILSTGCIVAFVNSTIRIRIRIKQEARK